MLRTGADEITERRGGGPDRVDVRVIAATNRDLEASVRAGRFREDLYYRLLVVPVRVPPLRERKEDVPLLARRFLETACRQFRVPVKALADDALDVLTRHEWPGNVRELRHAMNRAAILVPGALIHGADLELPDGGPARAAARRGSEPVAAVPPAGSFDLAEELLRYEKALILGVLERNHWKMTRAAEELRLERSHLYKKLRALGIEKPPEG